MCFVISFSVGLKKLPNLYTFLELDIITKTVIGWGNKSNTKKARDYATKHNLPYWALEDGFLRSVGLGIEGHHPLSLVVDDLGIYYDYSQPSRLEMLIMDREAIKPLLDDARRAIDLITYHHLSKYNHVAIGWPEDLSINFDRKQVLIIDQTAGDMALVYGGVTPATFHEMIKVAKKENPDADLWVKIHPDVLAGKKKGHLSELLNEENIRVLAQDINPISLLEKMDKVYTATSQMGFEACMMGKEVIVFGVPWYAGWGITDDRHADINKLKQDDRRRSATLEEVFTASYLQYCRYLNPYTNKHGDIFDVIHYLTNRHSEITDTQGIRLSLWQRRLMKVFGVNKST